jgi:hypothetical protein
MSNSNTSIQSATDKQKSAQYELTLLKSSAVLGVKNAPDMNMLGELSAFVFKYYRNFTSEDVQEAFRYAVANGVEHYGTFDMQFVARCLNSYRHIVDARIKREQERNANQLLLKAPTMTDKDAYDYLVNYYEKNNEMPMIYCWSMAFKGMLNTLPMEKAKLLIEDARKNAEHYQMVLRAETHHDYRTKESFIVKQLVDRITIDDGEREAQKHILINHIENGHTTRTTNIVKD